MYLNYQITQRPESILTEREWFKLDERSVESGTSVTDLGTHDILLWKTSPRYLPVGFHGILLPLTWSSLSIWKKGRLGFDLVNVEPQSHSWSTMRWHWSGAETCAMTLFEWPAGGQGCRLKIIQKRGTMYETCGTPETVGRRLERVFPTLPWNVRSERNYWITLMTYPGFAPA